MITANPDSYNIDHLAFKQALHAHCVALIQQRINNALQATNDAQASANNEEKSSAGDKYETGRAMFQLDKEMHTRQLAANRHELERLLSIDCSTITPIIIPGAVARTASFDIFIAAGLGKTMLNGRTIFLLSPSAPLAGVLSGKSAGATFEFNKQKVKLLSVF